MSYSIKAKLMIAVTSATVLGMSAFIQPAEAAPPSPQPYSLPSGNEEFIEALFTLVYTNDADGDNYNNEGIFKMAVKNYTAGIGRICTVAELNQDKNNICNKGQAGSGDLANFIFDNSNQPIFANSKGDACENIDGNLWDFTKRGKFTPCSDPVDLDLMAQFVPKEEDPFYDAGDENSMRSAAIAYIFKQDDNEIAKFWLRLDKNPGLAVFDAVNDLGFILQNNLLGKAERVQYKYDDELMGLKPYLTSDGAGKVRILPNTVATVPEPSITLAAFASVGTGLLLKRKTKQQPK